VPRFLAKQKDGLKQSFLGHGGAGPGRFDVTVARSTKACPFDRWASSPPHQVEICCGRDESVAAQSLPLTDDGSKGVIGNLPLVSGWGRGQPQLEHPAMTTLRCHARVSGCGVHSATGRPLRAPNGAESAPNFSAPCVSVMPMARCHKREFACRRVWLGAACALCACRVCAMCASV
jgi:hypothetical protein